MELRLIPAGHFDTGSPLTETGRGEDETEPRRIELPRPFYIGTCEVTNAQFRRFKPDHDSGSYEGLTLNHDDQPVVDISWHDAVAYCAWLSQRESRRYRLPTETEWEYACRAGTATPFWWGENADEAKLNFAERRTLPFGWSWSNTSSDDGYAVTAPVGSYSANAWGLRDMHGNVWEWCATPQGDVLTTRAADRELNANRADLRFAIRGGAWNEAPVNCRSANRAAAPPDTRNAFIGFRVVREAN
jgi:formylglycine-generating enzyme required for sulfatase activity